MTDPDRLGVGKAKVNARDRPLAPALWFPKPLVRDVETVGDSDGEDSSRPITRRPAEVTDPVPPDHRDSRFRSKMNE